MASSMHPQDRQVDLTTEPAQPDRSLGDLFGDMTRDISTLIRKELELAKTEMKEDAQAAGKAGALLGAGGVIGHVALILFAITLGFILDTFMWRWLAFLIVTILLAAVAGVLAMTGKKKLSQVNPTPEMTVQTLKEDAQWLSEQKS